MAWAEWAVAALTIYALVGFLFALAFVTRGARRVDPVAAGAPLGFRLLILPGVAAAWPLLAWRWMARRPRPSEKNAHRLPARDDA